MSERRSSLFLHVLLKSLLQGLAWAGLAAWKSEAGSFLGGFLLVWGSVFFVVSLLWNLLLWPLARALSERVSLRAPRFIWGTIEGALGAALLLGFLPVARSLGDVARPVIAVVTGLAWLLPGTSKGRLWVAVALPFGFVALLTALDPEGSYAERYTESVLDATRLPPGVAHAVEDPRALDRLGRARALAWSFIETHPPEALRWSWEEAVAALGVLSYGRVAEDSAAVAWVEEWLDAHVEHAAEETLWADAAAPVLLWLELDSAAVQLERVDRYVREEAPRTSRGVLSHAGALGGGLLPPMAWVDSLFMHGLYLNRRGAAWALEESETLGRGMVAGLLDPDAGLFRHAAFDLGPVELVVPVEDCFWARGNAWALYYLVDYRLACEAAGREPHPELVGALEAMLAAVLAAQDPESGLWPGDLSQTRASSPPETSSSALLACGLRRAFRAGLAGERALAASERAEQALLGFLDQVAGRARLRGTSTGTHPGFRAYYEAVPRAENVGHGVGAQLLLWTTE